MVLEKLKILLLKANTTEFVMIMVPMKMKYGSMGISFVRLNMLISILREKLQIGFPYKIPYKIYNYPI